MTARQRPWPRRWLMTDERLGTELWDAIGRLPAGEGGLVFRHYTTPPEERETLGRAVAQACRARGILLAVARDISLARELGAELIHNPAERVAVPFSLAVHTHDEAVGAARAGAALVFVSPVHATRSHPGAPALGPATAAQIAQAAALPAMALGGMDERAFAALPRGSFYGWAGIDAWLKDAG